MAAQRVDCVDAPGSTTDLSTRNFTLCVENVLVPTLAKGDIVILDNLGNHRGRRRDAPYKPRAPISSSCPSIAQISILLGSSSPSLNSCCDGKNPVRSRPHGESSARDPRPCHPTRVRKLLQVPRCFHINHASGGPRSSLQWAIAVMLVYSSTTLCKPCELILFTHPASARFSSKLRAEVFG